MYSVSNGDIVTTRLLLKAGIDINAADKDGCTALIQATKAKGRFCFPEIIELLLDGGADPNIKDNTRSKNNKNGKSAINYAENNRNLRGTSTLNRLKSLSN